MSEIDYSVKPTYRRIPVPLTDEEMEKLREVQEYYANIGLSSSAASIFRFLLHREHEKILTAKCLAEGKELPYNY